MVYENIKKIYGPYIAKDNRSRIVIVFLDGTKKTVSYPKFIMENHIGRKFTKNETVDHIDGDVTNNDIDNLAVIDRSAHAKLDAKRIGSQTFICEVCHSSFILEGRKLHDAKHNRSKGKKGRFAAEAALGKLLKI
jgi:hypothetical protein